MALRRGGKLAGWPVTILRDLDHSAGGIVSVHDEKQAFQMYKQKYLSSTADLPVYRTLVEAQREL